MRKREISREESRKIKKKKISRNQSEQERFASNPPDETCIRNKVLKVSKNNFFKLNS